MSKITKKQIGKVGVDTAQILITDPTYIQSEWDMDDVRIDFDDKYKDKKTGKKYEFGNDFMNYDDKIDGKTINELIERGRFVEIKPKREGCGNYSYAGCCDATLHEPNGAGQLNYKAGHAGAGVVVQSGSGDGYYPVYAYYNKDGYVVKVEVVFLNEEEISYKIPKRQTKKAKR